MTRRPRRVRLAISAVLAWSALLGGTSGAAAAVAGDGLRYGATTALAPGVDYRTFTYRGAHGTARGHLLTADLRDPGVAVDLLHPGVVAGRDRISRLADAAGAVGGVNADFFNITESQHPGVPATSAPVGPAIAAGRVLKSAVPLSQRFGPRLPPGTSTEDVLAIGTDKVARLDRLRLAGSVGLPEGTVPLGGLNQYALPVGGVGAYTSDWGSASRLRAACGDDTKRGAPCSDDTYEVTVSEGAVADVAEHPGRGEIPPGTVVLVGREAGAEALRSLRPGDAVDVRQQLLASEYGGEYRFAVGGCPILRGGYPLAGLEDGVAATRTAAGYGEDGHVVYLLALDGRAESGAGLTVAELASLMSGIGAQAAVNLDGGGSSTLVTRTPDAPGVTVRNHPAGGTERLVANGIGVFTDGG
ncbi:phosphodiester glycosidase family protein [Actinacidiphila sp. bgisy167]|uniref:phosphodiester glycosidase family protein n=1 Tax=Actinacidiphila sp. bgisy167 TaxID=3413797 RepID=UPI003D73F86D